MAAVSHEFGYEEEQFRRYRGMNPAFVRKVWAKRKATRRERVPPPPPCVVVKKTIGQILAERAEERRIKNEAERVAILKARIDEGGHEAIIAEVALIHNVTVEDILGPGRSHPLVVARHQAIIEVAIARPAFSLTKLGRIFKRDHTSILSVLKKYNIRGGGSTPSV